MNKKINDEVYRHLKERLRHYGFVVTHNKGDYVNAEILNVIDKSVKLRFDNIISSIYMPLSGLTVGRNGVLEFEDWLIEKIKSDPSAKYKVPNIGF